MLLIVASRDAEGDQAAAQPAADEAKHEAEDPAQGTLLLVHVCHTGVSAELALDCNRVVWPVVNWIWPSILNYNHLSTLRLSHHDRLSWSLRHHRLSHGSILWLAHLLRGVHGLLLVEHGLLLRHLRHLRHALSDIGSINLL